MRVKVLLALATSFALASCSSSGVPARDFANKSENEIGASGFGIRPSAQPAYEETPVPSSSMSGKEGNGQGRTTEGMVLGQDCVSQYAGLPRTGVVRLRKWGWDSTHTDLLIEYDPVLPDDHSKTYAVLPCGVVNGNKLEINVFLQADATMGSPNTTVYFRDAPKGVLSIVDTSNGQELGIIDSSSQTGGAL